MQRDTHRHGEREAERDTERDTRRHTERHFCVTGQCTNACRHDHATRRPRPQCGGGERACRGQHPNYATGTCTHHDPGRHERTSSAKLGRHIETRRDTDRHRHTHTLVVDARYVAVLPISRDDHTGPDEADYATQPSSLPGGGPAAGNSAWGPLRSAREPGISHAATSRDPAPSWVPVVIVQPRRSPVNAGFFTDRHTVHTHTHCWCCCCSVHRGTTNFPQRPRRARRSRPLPLGATQRFAGSPAGGNQPEVDIAMQLLVARTHPTPKR
jgi:hypothetical protein